VTNIQRDTAETYFESVHCDVGSMISLVITRKVHHRQMGTQ